MRPHHSTGSSGAGQSDRGILNWIMGQELHSGTSQSAAVGYPLGKAGLCICKLSVVEYSGSQGMGTSALRRGSGMW